MKLRLPHKFQAALIATLASVSFTTLSTGTLAVATGAALLAGQQAQAEDIVLSNVITVGTTKDTDYNSDVWGGTGGIITSATGRYSISGNYQDHTDTAYTNSFFAPETNIGTGNPYVFTLTFHTGTFDGPQTLSSISVDFLTYDSGGKAHSDNSCAIKCDWALALSDSTASGTISSVALPNNDHGGQNTAAYTRKDDGTYTTNSYAGGTANITLSDFQLESDKTYTLTLGVSKAAGPNGFFVGIGNIAFLYTPETFDYTWAATTAGTDWMADNAWTKDGVGATFTANGNATFGSGAASVVGVSSAVVANAVTIDGAAYTFTGNGTVTATTITFTGDGAGLTLGTKLDLTGQTELGALANVTVAEGGTLAVAAGTKSVINLDEASAGTLEIKSGSVSNTSAIGTADATLKLDNGTALYFDDRANHAFNHNLELGGDATIEVYGISYHPNGVTITGNVSGAGHKLTKQDGGQLTINGQVNLGTLNINSGSTVIINGKEGAQSTIGNVTSVSGSTLNITNTNLGISGGQTFQSNLEIGAGSTVTVKQTDSLKYSGITNTITLRAGGALDFGNFRWTVGSGTTIVMAGGTIQGAGDGTAALDFHQDGATIRATANSTISAPVKLRNSGQTTNFNVENGTTLTVSGTVVGDGNLHKVGAGELALSGTLSYTGNTVVDAGTLTVSSEYSLTKANQLQVNGGTANLNGAVTIGNAGTFSVAEGAALNFGGTVAVTRNSTSTRRTGPSRETGNGFGYVFTYASVGTGASGGTWTLNSHEATYNTATGEVGWNDADGSTYYIYTPEAISSVMGKNPTAVTVDTLGATQDLGNGSLSLTRLQIDSGVVTTTHSNGTGVVTGDIVINAGGTFKVIGEHDAFGYSGGQTDNIIMTGAAGNLATLELHQTTGNSVTMQTNIQMHGYSQILDAGDKHKGFNTFGGNISVTGTNNTIAHMSMRNAVTVDVANGGDLVISTLDDDANSGTRNLTKSGAGSLTVTNGSATLNNLNLNGGTLTFAGGTTTVNGKVYSNSDSMELVIGTGSGTAVLKANRIELGDIGDNTKHHNLTVNAGGTLKITGSNDNADYKNDSLVIGEWNVATPVVAIEGTLISENASLLGGDKGFNLNINGGTVLVKGYKTKQAKGQTLTTTISNNGRLILGANGLTTANTTHATAVNTTVNNGTIGVYADNVSIDRNIALSGAVTFDTQKYTVSDTTVSRGDAGGNLSISGNLTGNAAITKAGAGTLTLTGSNTITHTITLQGGSLAMSGGSVTVDALNIANFVQFGETPQEYTHGDSGFLASSALYYLVKGETGTTATKVDGLTLNGGSWATDEEAAGKTAGDLVFKFNTSETPGGIYYVNSNMDTRSDVTDGTNNLLTKATGVSIKEGVTLTAFSYSDSFTNAAKLHGAGTYALANGATTLNGNLSIGSDWTGIVRLTGASKTDINFAQFVNGTLSTIELKGFSGWAGSNLWKGINAQNFMLTNADNGGAAWTNGAYSTGASDTAQYTGKWSGTGTYVTNITGDRYLNHTYSGDISEWTGIFDKQGAGTSILTFTGAADKVNVEIKKTGGTLNVVADTDAAFGKAINASEFAVTAGHTATLSATATVGGLTGAGNIVSSGTVSLNGTTNYTMDGALTASVLERTSAATGTQTFNGLVTVTGGTRTEVRKGGFNFAGGYKYTGNNTYAIVTSSGTTVHFGGVSDMGGKLVGNGGSSTITVDAGATLTARGFWGTTTSSSGNGAVTIAAGATVTTTSNFNTQNLVNEGTLNVGGQLWATTLSGSGALTITNDLKYDGSTDGSYSGSITAKNITKEGTGKLTLSGVNTFTNVTQLNAGTLEVAQVGSLGGQGVTTGANTSLIFNTAAAGIYGGSITGSGSVTKSGEGELVLTGSNSYSGATTVSGGSLSLLGRNTLAGNITVNAGATLKLAASTTPVTGGSLTLEAASNLEISGINGTRARSGSSFTVASATGGITLNGVAPTLAGAYSGTVALDPTDNTKLVVSDVTQTGSIYHVYLLTGQSNSLGAVKDSPLNATMLAAYQAAGVQMYNSNITNYSSSVTNAEANPSWVQLAPQEPGGTVQAQAYFNNLCMGPEYGFAYMMQEKGWFTTEAFKDQDKLGVILASLDGGGNQYWLKDSATYANILQHVKDGLLAAKQQGCSAVSLDGLMYLQGESNDGTGAGAAATRYADFLGNLRGDLETWMAEEHITGIELVFNSNSVTGEPHLGNNNRQTTAANLLAAATSNGLVNADMNGLGHVLTNDLAVTNCDGQNVHYTGDSQLTIGARYAYAFAVQNGIDVGAVRGQDDSKKLNEAGAWWMETLPSSNAVATWDISSVSTVNEIATGETLTVGGIEIDEVYHNGATAKGQGSIAITGGTLSLGEHGIELTGADLSIGSAVDVRASQTWTTGSHTLTTGGTVTIANGATLTIAENSVLHFVNFAGEGSLSIGSGTTLGMTAADLETKPSNVTYSDGDNGYMSGVIVLSTLTGGESTITLGENLTGADALLGGTFSVQDGEGGTGASLVVNMGGESSTIYYVRKGEATYDGSDKFANATEFVLNTVADAAAPAVLNLTTALPQNLPVKAEGSGGIVSIGTGVVLTQASLDTQSGSIALAGTGEYVGNRVGAQQNFTAAEVLGSNITLDSSFAGSVVLSGGNTAYGSPYTDFLGNLTGLYTESSRVVLNDVYGFVNASSASPRTWEMNLEFRGTNADGTGTALTLTAGNGSSVSTFTGDISGKGDVFLNKAASSMETWKFTGDLANWTGKIVSGNKERGGLNVEIQNSGDTAKQVGFGVDNSVGSRSVNLTVAGDAVFNNSFTRLSSLTVNEGKAATFKATTEVTGATTVNGSLQNDGTMTLNGLTMAQGATFTNTGSLTLNGTITFGADGIVNSGADAAITLNSGNTFNISNITADENGVYTLFSSENGGALVDLSRYHYTAASITGGGDMTGKVWIFGTDGTLTAYTPVELAWNGTDGNNTWTTDSSVTNWTPYGMPNETAFHQGDKVTFTAQKTDATTAILGADIMTDRMTVGIAGGEPATLTVKNGEGTHHTLEVNELVVNGNLTTDSDTIVKNVSIAQGGVWNTSADLNLANLTYSNAGTLKLLAGADATATTAQALGAVSAEEGATLTVTGTGTYTLAGAEGDPFSGRLIYNIGSTPGHGNGISLSNFNGVLEIRGRVTYTSCAFDQASKIVFNGDRSSNTTGIWDSGSFTLDMPLEITGPNRVDFYASQAINVNGDINADGAKGYLGKQNGAALNLNGNVNVLGLFVDEGSVNLNGGAEKDYNLGVVNMGGGSLAIGAQGVKSLTATDLVVRAGYTLSSAAAEPTVFNVTRFDVSNYGTNMTLQNVTLNVSGAATAAVLNTAQANDQATVTVGDKATLNLDGGVVWNKVDEKDASKTDYVNLTINAGGEANITKGTANVLNDVTVNAGGALSFGTGTTTTVAGTLTLNDTITNSGSLTLGSGTVAANQTGTIAGSGTVTLNGTIGGAGTFKLDGATLTGGTNAAVSGNMVIDGGTLAGTMSIGSNSANTVRVTEVFTVQDDANVTFNGTMVLDDLADVTVIYTDAEQDTEKNGFITGVSARVFNIAPGSESVIFAGGSPTYKGITGTIVDGVFYKQKTDYTTFYVNVATETAETYSHALAMADAGHGDFTKVELAAGTSFDIDQDAILNTVTVTGGSASLTGSHTLSLGTDAAAVSLAGAGSLTIDGLTVTINGTNSDYTGDIDVLSGTLKLGSSSDHARYVLGALNIAGQTPDRTITIGTGATLDINDKADANYVYTLQGGRLTNSGNGLGNGSSQTMGLIVNADSYVGQTGQNGEFWLRKSNAYSATPILTLNANLTKQGGSTFGLHNTTVTGTGAIVVQEGTLSVTDGGTFAANLQLAGGTVSGTLNLAGNTVITTTAASTFSAAISTNGHGVTFAGNLDQAVTGAITGNGHITKTGIGTLTLSGANTYPGGFTVAAGATIVVIRDHIADAGTLTADGDGVLRLVTGQDGNGQGIRPVTAKNLELGDNANNNSRFFYGTASNLNGVQNLYFDGAQLWLSAMDMTGGNAFKGAVTFGTTTYKEGGNAFEGAAIRVEKNGNFAGTVNVQENTKFTWGANQTLELSGTVSGSGNLNLASYNNNTGTFKISGDASNYQGATTSNSHITVHVTESGKMNLATDSNLAGAVQLDAGGKMTVSGDSTISGAINGTGSLEVKKDATLNYNRTAETTVAAQLSGEGTLQYTGTGTTKFTGDVSNFSGSVDVQAGELNIMNIAQATSLNVKDVTIAANATMGVYNSDNATPGTANEGTLTMKNGNTLKAAGAGATLNANVVMESGSTLEVSLAQATHGLTMGCSMSLNTGDLLGTEDLVFVQNLKFGDYYYLYNGVDSLSVNGTQYDSLNFKDWTDFDMDASTVYTQLDEKRYALVYSWNGSNVGRVAITLIPEPTTGTLSLLALCALAARRRRK